MNSAVKKDVIATLIKAGRPDLATAMAHADRQVEAKLPYYAELGKMIRSKIDEAKRSISFILTEMEKQHQDAAIKKLRSAVKHLEEAASDVEITKGLSTQ